MTMLTRYVEWAAAIHRQGIHRGHDIKKQTRNHVMAKAACSMERCDAIACWTIHSGTFSNEQLHHLMMARKTGGDQRGLSTP
mmetsp:Transcript_131822/g.293903  ORF Transcript_131822/g.293903 Transcript_131822/m.293903 type:complete len:82 (-) Transcript_131822:586-831(-)